MAAVVAVGANELDQMVRAFPRRLAVRGLEVVREGKILPLAPAGGPCESDRHLRLGGTVALVVAVARDTPEVVGKPGEPALAERLDASRPVAHVVDVAVGDPHADERHP